MADTSKLAELTADIVSAYVANNAVPAVDLPMLIHKVFGALGISAQATPEVIVPEAKPAVSIRRSVADDHITCLEDGKTFKSLKRHLRTDHDLSPQQYREKWKLPSDYPMVAPNYAKSRSELAKKMGLGSARRRKR